MPAGLTLDPATGLIARTPTAAGKFAISLQANGAGGTGNQALSLTINKPASSSSVITNKWTTLSVSSSNPSVQYQITATDSPILFSISGLPSGLSFDVNTGLIKRTMSAKIPRVYDLTITVKNASGSISSGLSLVVTGSPNLNPPLAMRSDAFELLDWLVTAASERGIYTIIDMHGVFGGQSESDTTGHAKQNQYWTNPVYQAHTQEMWTAIAAHFNGNPWVAGYDLLNEPTGAPNDQAVINQLSSLYMAIRAVDPNHLIFMEGTWGKWNWDMLKNPSSLGWKNVVYEMHEYQFTNPTASGVKAGADHQVSDFKSHKSWNVPAYIGEFNAFGTGTQTWQYVVNAFNNVGMHWSSWSYKAIHGSDQDSWELYNSTGTWPPVPDLTKDSSSTIASDWSKWTTVNAFAANPMTITVLTGPSSITSRFQATCASGSSFIYTVNATALPTSFSATGLPAGLSLDPTTGVISGVPTTQGVFNIGLSATTSSGTPLGVLRLTVTPPVPVLTGKVIDTATVGVAYTYKIAALNRPGSFGAKGLPAGLTINSSTGVISGVPTGAGNSSATLSATNSWGTGTQILTLTTNPPAPVITSPAVASANAGMAFSYTVMASNAPTSFDATGLPEGLTMDKKLGVISGSPTQPGVSTVNLTATNSGGAGKLNLTLTVNASQQTVTFSSWMASSKSSGLDISPTATPLNDGISNLLKYLCSIPADKPMTAADRASLPVASIDSTTIPGTQYLALTYRQNSSLTGLSVNLETSPDLQNWTMVVPPKLLIKRLNPDVSSDPLMEMGVPITPGSTDKQFIRLRINGGD